MRHRTQPQPQKESCLVFNDVCVRVHQLPETQSDRQLEATECGCWKLNAGPPEEQETLLTNSLQPPEQSPLETKCIERVRFLMLSVCSCKAYLALVCCDVSRGTEKVL